MTAKRDDVKDLVKRAIKMGLMDKAGTQRITFAGEDMHVDKADDGSMKIKLPRLRKSYLVMSGRVYEREYAEEKVIRVEAIDQESSTVTQLNYQGDVEKVDASIFKNKLICSCGGVRYIKNADRHQVTKCKPCTIKDRSMRRRQRTLSVVHGINKTEGACNKDILASAK